MFTRFALRVTGLGLLGALGFAEGCGSSSPPILLGAAGSVSSGGCQRTTDCPADKVCTPDGRCVECYSDRDCLADEHCTQELCVKTVACSSASDCASDQACTDGQCAPVRMCASSSDCAAGYDCNTAGVCVACADPTCGAAAGGAGGTSSGGTSSGGNSSGGVGVGGAAGSAPGGAGGTAGKAGSGGVAGTGAGGTAGATGKSVPIVTSNGEVLPGTNSVGVEGEWVAAYPAGSTLNYIASSPDFLTAGSQVCVAGFVGGGGAATEWGASVYLYLNGESAYAPATYGVAGFGFTITGSNVPANLQFNYNQVDGTTYCDLLVPGAGSHTFLFSDATFDCWNPGGASATAAMSYQMLWIQAPSSVGSYSFDFCVTDLHAILQ